MAVAQPLHESEQPARLGIDVLQHGLRPPLRPEDEGKFVAIDRASGEYEVDADDYTAVMRLRARCPAADIWLECVGRDTAYEMRCAR